MDPYTKVKFLGMNWSTNSDEFTPFGGPQPTIKENGSNFNLVLGASGARNPLWRDQIRRGVNATTSFVGSDAVINDIYFTIEGGCTFPCTNPLLVNQSALKRHIVTGGNLQIQDPSVFPDPSSDLRAEVTNRCIRKFIETCQDKLSSLELGQDLGELKETIHSIHRPLGSLQDKLIKYISKLKKVRSTVRSAKVLRKVLADTYLELHFGILPVVDDVTKILSDIGRFRYPVYPVSASASGTYDGSVLETSVGNPGYASNFHPTQNVKSHTHFTVRYKGAIRTNSGADGRISASQAYRFLPSDWLPTAYELLPWSWVVDYFVNIGDIIQAACFSSSNLAWGCVTNRTERTVEYSEIFLRTPDPFAFPDSDHQAKADVQHIAYGGNATLKFRRVNRFALQEADLIPTVRFSIPSGKFPYLNGLAVLQQRTKKLIPFF